VEGDLVISQVMGCRLCCVPTKIVLHIRNKDNYNFTYS